MFKLEKKSLRVLKSSIIGFLFLMLLGSANLANARDNGDYYSIDLSSINQQSSDGSDDETQSEDEDPEC